MAVTTHTLTGDFNDLIGGDIDPRLLRARVTTNVANGKAIVDTTTGDVYLGEHPIDVAADGTFTVAGLPATNDPDLNITGGTLRYMVVVEHRLRETPGMGRWDSGWFELTADVHLGQVVGTDYIDPTFASQVQTFVIAEADRATAAASDAEAAGTSAEAARTAAETAAGQAEGAATAAGVSETAAGAAQTAAEAARDTAQGHATAAASSATDAAADAARAESAADQAAAPTAEQMTAVDADPASTFRQQQDARLSATYVSVTEAPLNVMKYGAAGDETTDDRAAIQSAIDAAAAGGEGEVYLPSRRVFGVGYGITVPSNVTIRGGGRGSTVLKLHGTAPGDARVITNADHPNGNDHFYIHDLTVDGNKSAFSDGLTRYGITFHHSHHWGLHNVEIRNAYGQGLFALAGEVRKRFVKLHNVAAVDCDSDGIWIGWGTRGVEYVGVVAENNGGHGVVIDHSEARASSIYANGNAHHGIWIRNTFGGNLNGLTATLNGRHGILVDRTHSTDGAGWHAANNSQEGAGLGYNELHFTNEFAVSDPGYGPTSRTVITGVFAGTDGQYSTPKKADYGIYIADGVVGVKIIGATYGNNGAIGVARVPTDKQDCILLDSPAGPGQLILRAGGIRLMDGPLKIDGGITANRPPASVEGAGAMWYDTTLGKPIWSDGTVWRDASGTAV